MTNFGRKESCLKLMITYKYWPKLILYYHGRKRGTCYPDLEKDNETGGAESNVRIVIKSSKITASVMRSENVIETLSHPQPTCFTNLTPVVSLLPPALPPRTIAWTVSSELLGFCYYFFLSVPCARLSCPSRKLLSAHESTVSYPSLENWQMHLQLFHTFSMELLSLSIRSLQLKCFYRKLNLLRTTVASRLVLMLCVPYSQI